ncbi:hypothetical protein I8748_27070 [Nostoc sp. CENA67]|uniref:Peptide ABC transporter substrate-binding protein n=1 Tax=Amazonocrinis nigriterrae CENA67 TaxID=2794033 RepID=A0A8J7HYG0_9NOST|nr:hypothetical protein [Amazonocrinis nigriterrae]MBH8565788.1 hypothetical protein [Amazonocrinis nigriterrae CENA67]
MTTSFLANAFQTPTPSVSSSTPAEITSSREPVRVVIFGSKTGVNSTILTLYKLGFAQVNEWSPLLPSSNPGEFMSILVRYILRT